MPDGRERVVRHGHGPERLVQTGIGVEPRGIARTARWRSPPDPVEVQRVKLRDRGAGQAGADRIRFTSTILPRWARRTRSVEPRGIARTARWRSPPDLDALLPVLYLRGVSMGDFQEALGALLGKDAPRLPCAPRLSPQVRPQLWSHRGDHAAARRVGSGLHALAAA